MDKIEIIVQDRGVHGIELNFIINGEEISHWGGTFFRNPVDFAKIANLFAIMLYDNLVRSFERFTKK